MKDVRLLQGDCLERMREIPAGSVDMVLCDPPYGITENEWDTVIDGKAMFKEYKRICKQNVNVLLFCNIGFAKYLMESTFKSEFSHCLIWVKNNVTRFNSASTIPLSKYEMILCFRINKYNNKNSHIALRKYFLNELEKSGLSVKEIEASIPNRAAHHWFSMASDYRIPTQKNYLRLQEVTGMFNRPYQAIRNEFGKEKDNYVTYHSGYLSNDVIFSELTEKRVHPTQKPVALLEKLIRAYSNEGGLILDNCMGSGSTGVACQNTGRKFIGIEKDIKYFQIAKLRMEENGKMLPGNTPIEQMIEGKGLQLTLFDFLEDDQ